MNVDAQALAAKLKRQIKGEVRFDNGSRALYATDGSNYRQTPIGVVLPKDREDVIAAVGLCREFNAPITSRGCGTSLAGQCCNVAVILDFSKYMNRILEIDPARKLARVEPGCVCDTLRDAAEEHHLTFGPDPATHAWCTLGGMIGNNACGLHSQMAGRTSDNVEALDVLTYDGVRMTAGTTTREQLRNHLTQVGGKGEIYRKLESLSEKYGALVRARFPRIPRRVSGYNLDALLPENGFHLGRALTGSEGTCVVILEAVLNLVHSPPHRSLLVVAYPDVFTAGDHVPEIVACGPIGLEGIDRKFIHDMRKKGLFLSNLELFPEGGAYLLAEFGGESEPDSAQNARRCMRRLGRVRNPPSMKIFRDLGKEQRIWNVRESGLGATAHIPGMKENWEGWEDSAVAPEHLGKYLRALKKLYEKYGYVGSLYGHFGQGCVHTRIDFDLKSAGGVRKFRSFISEASSLICEFGGSLSGEHGDGQSRAEFLEKMFGPELIEAFKEFKSIWDPDWKMNPGKLVKPNRVDENLRFGPHYNPAEPETFFHYGADGFSFASAMERCVGVGKCRQSQAGTMCPSYMATGEEMHSTRGRARLLFEMLRGETLHDGWRSEPVKQALDLCLACKGCKGDCPVHVDMATYKAEFLAHYYRRRIRPLHAYVFGYIDKWAALASIAPSVANYFSHAPGFGRAMKWMLGLAPERQIPSFAGKTFRSWFSSRAIRNPGAPLVILWADTFNNYFQPQVAQCAVEVLEDAGFCVQSPGRNLCCGRPLYDFGLLKSAKAYLENVLGSLQPQIEAGLPFVVLEPSCCSVFRDELMNLLPHNENAKRLRNQTFTLGEFLTRKAPGYKAPILHARAVLHGHCHQKAIMKMSADAQLLRRMQLDCDVLDAGCCGLAGAFGYLGGEHYRVSVRCGERVLLPRARSLESGEYLISDGFSCREQIAQQTGKRALHLAEILHLALQTGERERDAVATAEQHMLQQRNGYSRYRWLVRAGAAMAAGAIAWTLRSHR